MKIKNIYYPVLLLSIFATSAMAAKYGDWDLKISVEGPKRATIFTTEKSTGNYPLLIIDCAENRDKKNGFETYIYSQNEFKSTEDPTVISVSFNVDDAPSMNMLWGVEGKALWMINSSWLIKDMAAGKSFVLKFDESDGRKEYKYSLNGLNQALESAQIFCGFTYSGELL